MDSKQWALSRVQWAFFWSVYFVLFVQQWIGLLTERSFAQGVVGFLLLSFPVVLNRSAEALAARQRGISAQFVTILAIASVMLFVLVGVADAPLTFFLDPDAVKQTLGDHPASASLMHAVVKVYSVFDVMSLVGTVATLTLVGIASLIPEETQQIREQEANAQRAHHTAHEYFGNAYRLLDIEPEKNEFANLTARQNALWISLQFMMRASPSQRELDNIGRQLRETLASSDASGRQGPRSVARTKLMELERSVASLIRTL